MNILETALIVVYAIISVVLIAICLMQSKDDEGASASVVGGGSSSSSFYEKNKGRTKEGKLKRLTIILGVLFIILTVALGIIYML